MKHWSLQDAEAKFGELVNAAEREGPQLVTRRGVEAVVVVPIDEWRRLQPAKTTAKNAIDILLHDPRKFDLDLPKRSELFANRPLPEPNDD